MEFAAFGLNILTFAFAGTVVFNFVQVYGYLKQASAVRRARSGRSVGTYWFVYLTAMYLVIAVYGFSTASLALIINGFINGVFLLPLIYYLWKFDNWGLSKHLALVLAGALVFVSVVVPYKAEMFLLLSVGSFVFSLNQPWEIWKNRDAGVVEIRLIGIYIVSTLFWIIYGYAAKDWVLKIVSPAFLSVLVLVAVLWALYRKPHVTSEFNDGARTSPDAV